MSFHHPLLDAAWKAWEAMLTPAEAFAANEYRGDHEIYNGILWDEARFVGHHRYAVTRHAHIPALESALQRGALPLNLKVYRGQAPPVGAKDVIKGFASTSTNIEVAWQFATAVIPGGDGVILEIPLHAGHPVGYLDRAEYELLLPIGLSYEVSHARLHKGIQVYEARLI